jgi:ATP-dependent Clp protease ATP-binding subunit ClpC
MVDEPTAEETIAILEGLRDRYEAHHRVKISDDALEAAVKLADRYVTDRFLPDKAIDLIDEAGSRVRLSALVPPDELKEIEHRIEEAHAEKEAAIKNEEFERAAKLRDQEQKLQEELKEKKEEWAQKKVREVGAVGPDDIAEIVSSWTGIPVKKLAEAEGQRLLRLEEILHERVVGQDEALTAVSRAIRRARAGLKDPKRPIGSFIFLGPTGVGKTELARALAEAMFGDEDVMIRLDMSEYQERHTVARLIGAPPGYVGYDEGGQLTEKVRRKPYSVVLFDEVEKAHPEVFNVLLQVLEDGRLTDGKGRTVDFRNTIIIMTSNVGARELKRTSLGFRSTGENGELQSYEEMKNHVTEELRKTFRPEFLNRVDEMIVFHALTEEEIKRIVSIMVDQFLRRLKETGLLLTISEAAQELLVKKGFDPEYGARPLRRAIEQLVENPLAEEVLQGRFKAGDQIMVDAEADKMVFRTASPATP